jgi:hypothetical protein
LDAVAYCSAACSDGLAISRFGGPRARCADEQGLPSWIRPGDRPPVQRSEIARYNVELLQVIEGPPGQPGGPSTIFGIGLVKCQVWMPSRTSVSSRLPHRKSPGTKMFQKTKEFGRYFK